MFEYRAVGVDGSGGAEVVRAASDVERPVFVFGGQGSLWIGAAWTLLDESPVFAARFAECVAALAPYVDVDLRSGDGWDRVEVVQPLLWAVMVSLAQVWLSFGVVPAAVVGHSQGEIAAATVAGVLGLDEGARVVALRARELRALAGRGAMAAVELPVGEVVLPQGVSVAAVNGPASVVVSGEPGAVQDLVDGLVAGGVVRARVLPVDYASHSAQVDEVAAAISAALGEVRAGPGRFPLVSSVTGEVVDGADLAAGYWFDNVRQPVRFADAVRTLVAAGHRAFVEVSPHPVLLAGVAATAEEAGVEAVVVPSVRRDRGGYRDLLLSVGQAFSHGVAVDWSG
ncbi:MAG: acyltransferase domain-containing protein, partial [Acidimicrobiales bacterium]